MPLEIDRISVSRARAYEQCPLYYDAIYNQGIRQTQDHLVFGSVIHDTLEEYHKDPSKDILEIFDRYWREYDITNFDYFTEGREMLREYLEVPEYHKDPIYYDEEGPFLERYFKIPLDPKGKVIASGIIDRLNKLSDTEVEVIDYKTSRQAHTKEEMEKDIQLSMYNIAINSMLPHIEKVHLSLLFLRFDKITTHRNEEQLEDARQYFINIFYQILLNEKPQPKLNRYCGTCPIKHQCPLFKDLTKEERMILGDMPDALPEIWDELENIKDKQKILEDRRKELEEALQNHLRNADENHLMIGRKKIYIGQQQRSFYPYGVVKKALGVKQAEDLAYISKTKVDKAAKGNQKAVDILERGKVIYYTNPSLHVEEIGD